MNQIRISLFGAISLEYVGEQSQPRLTTTSGILLAYLILNRGQPQPRDVLASLLWEEYSTERAHACLNTALWRLRQVLEPGSAHPTSYIVSTPMGDVSFNHQEDLWIDVINFEEKLRQCMSTPFENATQQDICELESAAKLYKGDFLKGCYSDWALRERERLRQHYLDILYYLVSYYEQQGNYHEALVIGRQILDTDQLREDVHRKLMGLYVANGQRSLAIRQYRCCRDLLRAELDIEPMPETQILMGKIVSQSEISAVIKHDGDGDIRLALAQLQSAIEILGRAEQDLQQALSRSKS